MRFDQAFASWEREAATRGKSPAKPHAHKLRREASDMAGMQRAALSRQFPDVDPLASRPLSYGAELSDDEVVMLTEWFDRRWQEMQDATGHAAQRRDALRAAADELASQLRTDGWTVVPFDAADIDAVIGRDLGDLRARAGDPRNPSEAEVIHKFRIRVQLRLIFRTTVGRKWLADELALHTADEAAGHAWAEVGRVEGKAESGVKVTTTFGVALDTPPLVEVPERLERPECMGRHPWTSLCLWLLPNGPVAARPLPADLAEAIEQRAEGGVLADVIAGEIRRSSYPAGLIDRQWRCAWLLSVLLLTASWTKDRTNQAATVALEDCGFGIRGAVAAVRYIDQLSPDSSTASRPGRLDRMRHAAAIQHQWPTTTNGSEDADGWWREVAAIAFTGAEAYRCAVPWATALELGAVTPVGAVMMERFGRKGNRAYRFGVSELEQMCQRTVELAGRKVWQLLLKQDQAPDGLLAYGSAKQWNGLLQKHVNLLATSVVRQHAARRVPMDGLAVDPNLTAAPDVMEPEDAAAIGALHAAASAHDELRPLIAVREGAATARALARLTTEWNRRRSDVAATSAVTTKLRWLRLFEDWISSQHGVAEDLAQGALRGVHDPLRNLFHHFVETGVHRPGKTVTRTNNPVETRSMERALERDSLQLYRLVESMVSDMYGATRDGRELTR